MAKKKQITVKKRKKGKQNEKLADGQEQKQPNDVGPSIMGHDKYQGLFLIVLIAVGISIYANTFNAPFTFDDIPAIEENHSVRMTELSAKNMISGASRYSGSRPASMLSFALNYYFGRYNVVGYHLSNIIIHIITGILLFFFLKITLKLANEQEVGNSESNLLTIPLISFCAALLWLVCPLHSQSVTYIVQRMNSMGAMFFLLSLLLYARGRISVKVAGKLKTQNSQSETPKHYFWFIGCGLAGVLGLGSKENTVTLPLFIILYEWYFFQDLRKEWLRRNLKYFVGASILFILIAFMYLGLDPLGKIAMLTDYASGEFTMGERALTQFRVVIYYLSLLLYPHPSRLNVDYDFPLSHSLIDPVTTLLCLLVIIGLVGLAVNSAKKDRLLSFCILWFFGNLIIESSILPLAVIYEHRTYLPSMLVILMAVMLAFRYVKSRPAVVAGLCFVGIVCSLWTYERNKVWSDDVSLWRDCVEKSPRKARPHNNLGFALAERGNLEEGIRHLSEALRIRPEYAEAHNNLGAALERQGHFQEAVGRFSEALRIRPEYAEAHYNLGFTLAGQGNFEEAIRHFSEALRIKPEFAEAHFHLGNALLHQGSVKEAIRHFSEALRIKPEYTGAHNNLGTVLARQGKLEEAISHFSEALRVKPDFVEAHYNLGNALLNQGSVKDAIRHYTEALEIEPDHRKARGKLDAFLQNEGTISP